MVSVRLHAWRVRTVHDFLTCFACWTFKLSARVTCCNCSCSRFVLAVDFCTICFSSRGMAPSCLVKNRCFAALYRSTKPEKEFCSFLHCILSRWPNESISRMSALSWSMRMKMLLDMGIALLLCHAVSRHQCKFRGPAGRIIM